MSMNNGQTFNNIVVIVPSPASTSFGSSGQELMEEQPYAKRRMATMGSDQAGQAFNKHYMSTSKILGVKRTAIQTEDNYKADTASNPVNQWYWHVGNYVPGGTSQSLIQDIIITYYCVFESRTRPAIS